MQEFPGPDTGFRFAITPAGHWDLWFHFTGRLPMVGWGWYLVSWRSQWPIRTLLAALSRRTKTWNLKKSRMMGNYHVRFGSRVIASNACLRLTLPKWIHNFQFSKREATLVVHAEYVFPLLCFLKNHSNARFRVLIDVCGVDYPSRKQRFEVVYKCDSFSGNTEPSVGKERGLRPELLSSYGWKSRSPDAGFKARKRPPEMGDPHILGLVAHPRMKLGRMHTGPESLLGALC